jgi:hypothetical protein
MRHLLLAAALFLGAGCFNPDQPACSYACADSDPRCPYDYECRADGYCHLVGTGDTTCNFTPPADMSMSLPADQAHVPSDMSGSD